MNHKPIIALAAALALVAVAAIIWAIHADNEWSAWCESQGGHVSRDTNTVTVIGANGKPGVGTSTTSFCLTADGRILDIQ